MLQLIDFYTAAREQGGWRCDKGSSQGKQDLAGKASRQNRLAPSLHLSLYIRIEKGEKLPSLAVLYKIAKAFDLTLTQLVAMIEEKITDDEQDYTS